MKRNKRKTYLILSVLFIILCLGLTMGLTLGKYVGEWDHGFGLQISPVEKDETDHTLRRYFRSNELLPVSEAASYAVNGTSAWFTVANALDSSTVSQDKVDYKLTWYVSIDGSNWTEYKTESGSFAANVYKVDKYTVEPVTLSGVTNKFVKVHGKTTSFLQEDIEAIYSFSYSDHTVETDFADGVITVKLDTNDASGNYGFRWSAGIAPDNSDPTGIFANAVAGPSELNVTLNKNTAYEFLFFVTDSALLEQLHGGADVTTLVSVVKK